VGGLKARPEAATEDTSDKENQQQLGGNRRKPDPSMKESKREARARRRAEHWP
jgi:hypothetical protein